MAATGGAMMILPCLETTFCALAVWLLLRALVLEETEVASESSVARFSVQSANNILLTAGFRRFRKWLSLGENCAACGAHGGAERWEAGGRESGAEIALT